MTRERPVAIKQWHPGKIVMVWLVAVAFFVLVKEVLSTDRSDWAGWFVLTVSSIGPAVALVLTWIWLTGREGK